MPNAAARRAISLPIPPRAMTRSVLPASSSRTTPGPLELPLLVRLGAHEVSQAAGEAEQVADRLVGDLGAVSALHVGQDDVAFDQLGDLHQVLDAGAGLLDPAQRFARADDGRREERHSWRRHQRPARSPLPHSCTRPAARTGATAFSSASSSGFIVGMITLSSFEAARARRAWLAASAVVAAEAARKLPAVHDGWSPTLC